MTISIAAYNAEKTIGATLDTLVRAKYIDYLEILVINDGSKDNTKDVVEGYVRRYPNSVNLINKPNGGYGSTINISSAEANGKYYKLLDADDWFDTDNLDKLIEDLKIHDEDMIFNQYVVRPESGKPDVLKEQKYLYNKTCSAEDVSGFCMHALTIKSELIRSNMRITEKCYYTDVEFFIKCVLRSRTFISLPYYVYIYRLGREGQSVSVESMIAHSKEHELITKKALAIMYKTKRNKRLRVSIENLARDHAQMLLSKQPTKDNWDEYYNFCRYIKVKYPKIKITVYCKLAYISYFWLYRPLCLAQRKKLGL